MLCQVLTAFAHPMDKSRGLRLQFGHAFNLTSDFGFDYARSAVPVVSVPEPETYAMMLMGISLMGFIARRRRGNQA